MAQRLRRKRDDGCNLLHAGAECRAWKLDNPNVISGIADALTIELDFSLGHGEAGALVQELGTRDQTTVPVTNERSFASLKQQGTACSVKP